jgi:hypothetical protein
VVSNTAPSLIVPKPGEGIAPSYLWHFLGPRKGQPYKPFPAQFECIDAIKIPWPGMMPDPKTGLMIPYPTIIGANCGRRLGKTTMAEVIAWHGFTAPDDFFGPPTVRITADTFEHGRKIWDRFVYHAETTDLSALIKRHDRARFFIEGVHGATIQLLSAENPQALAGDGVTLWLVDEAQYLSYPAWENLFPSTAERNGVIALFGVSEGSGPFREICYKGDNPTEYPEFLRLCYPTAANPFVPRWRIDFARRQYTPSRFKQLYLAQWDDETGKVFRNVKGCIDPRMKPVMHPKGWAEITPPRAGHTYFGGIDLALHSDWCVFTISDREGNLVAWDRFNGGTWELLKARLFELSLHYRHPLTWVDSTGSGDPIFEDLQRRGMHVQGYRISTNEKKRQLVDELAVRVGSGQLHYPNNRLLVTELERFEATQTASGVITYQAPSGEHDDIVIALSLMVKGVPRPLAPVVRDQLVGPHALDLITPPRNLDPLSSFDPDMEDMDEEFERLIRDQQQMLDYSANLTRPARDGADYM